MRIEISLIDHILQTLKKRRATILSISPQDPWLKPFNNSIYYNLDDEKIQELIEQLTADSLIDNSISFQVIFYAHSHSALLSLLAYDTQTVVKAIMTTTITICEEFITIGQYELSHDHVERIEWTSDNLVEKIDEALTPKAINHNSIYFKLLLIVILLILVSYILLK